MKINPTYRPTPDTPSTRSSGSAPAPSAPAATPSTGSSAQVEFSAAATALQSAEGDVNLERVQALREAIRQGQLSYDTGKIADGLLESVRELLQADSSQRG